MDVWTLLLFYSILFFHPPHLLLLFQKCWEQSGNKEMRFDLEKWEDSSLVKEMWTFCVKMILESLHIFFLFISLYIYILFCHSLIYLINFFFFLLHYNLNVLSLPFQLHVPHFSTIEGRELKSRLGSSARFVKATVWNRIVGQRYAAYFLLTCGSICFAEKKKGFSSNHSFKLG